MTLARNGHLADVVGPAGTLARVAHDEDTTHVLDALFDMRSDLSRIADLLERTMASKKTEEDS